MIRGEEVDATKRKEEVRKEDDEMKSSKYETGSELDLHR